ncbi:hypothetical protein HYV86_02130 [Candidatus Woesearchaeota archaeon]|nr:hypothetical protein [Candidatus Woesearchaeota archaeon]
MVQAKKLSPKSTKKLVPKNEVLKVKSKSGLRRVVGKVVESIKRVKKYPAKSRVVVSRSARSIQKTKIITKKSRGPSGKSKDSKVAKLIALAKKRSKSKKKK